MEQEFQTLPQSLMEDCTLQPVAESGLEYILLHRMLPIWLQRTGIKGQVWQ
jgi:hypothetical protein